MMFRLFACVLLLLMTTNCSSQKHDKFSIKNIVYGSKRLKKTENQHIFHAIRALGQPSETLSIGNKKYYKWKHERFFGLNYFLIGGFSTTMYCTLTVETDNKNKIQYITWYGSDCDIYLASIKSYFNENLNQNLELETTAEYQSKEGSINSQDQQHTQH